MPSSGSQVPGWQRYIPRSIPLVQTGGSNSGATATINFMVPVPDSRLRVKISLIFIRAPGSGGATNCPPSTLWISENDVEDAGFNGGQIPLVNIEGTAAAPTAIPIDAGGLGLFGYSREFFTAADYLQGQLVVTNNSVQGYWVLQTRYQPQVVGMRDSEWETIINQCNPTAPKMLVIL